MDYIYTNNSLSFNICDKIISYYEESDKYKGVTVGGLNKTIKDTTDYIIPFKSTICTQWDEINDVLTEELQKNIKHYISKINNKANYTSENNYGVEYRHLNNEVRVFNNFMIQKYEKGIGKYVYHQDGLTDIKNNGNRVITYLWYLNDVEEGGETEFFGDFKIKPEKGKLLLFPANWAFPHRGNRPVSSHKYIITGWFYELIKPLIHRPLTQMIQSLKCSDKISEKVVQGLYSPQMCLWVLKHIDDTDKIVLDKIPSILPLVISSFQIIDTLVKDEREVTLNIREWYIAKGDMEECDLFLCVSLVSGDLYINQSCEDKCIIFIVQVC